MAAGLGFKNFASGEVLTAADVNAYLNSQTVMVFADATARTAAITSPQEGMFSYLKDTNATQYYTGSAWTNLDTTGMVNPMTTTGDTIYSSSGTTPARLGIGSTGQVLTVAGGVPTWATPAAGGGGKVLQVVSATTTTSTTIATTSFTDTTITATITPTSATSKILVILSYQLLTTKAAPNLFFGAKLLRDATTISDYGNFNFIGYEVASSASSFYRATGAITNFDTPNTTSATTYKLQARCEVTTSSQSMTFQDGSTPSTITLLEIGA